MNQESRGFELRHYFCTIFMIWMTDTTTIFLVDLSSNCENKRKNWEKQIEIKTSICKSDREQTLLNAEKLCFNMGQSRRLLRLFIVLFKQFIKRKKLETSAGFELGSSEWKVIALTTSPPQESTKVGCDLWLISSILNL